MLRLARFLPFDLDFAVIPGKCAGRETPATAGQETGGTTGLHPSEYKSFAGDPGLERGATT